MSQKLYLIRRNLESFLGPLSLGEVRNAYKRMEFGLQDEIAASFRDWVAFDDIEKIKKVYPELVDLVTQEMLSGWGVTDNAQTKIIRSKSRKGGSKRSSSSSSSSRGRKSSRGLLFKLMTVLAIAVVAAMAYIVARHGEMASKFFSFKDPNPDKAQELLASDSQARFEAYMDRYRKDILGSIQSRSTYLKWIPYLRIIAYRREGLITGLSNPRYLQGLQPIPAPTDCSVPAWKARWRRSQKQWGDYLRGTTLPKIEWAKVLAWDPFWINRRSPMEGWYEPGSYYEACLAMALKAINDLGPIAEPQEAAAQAVLAARLNWQLKIVRGETVGEELAMSGTMWALSCLESSSKNDSLGECVTSLEPSSEWEAFLGERTRLTTLRLMIDESNAIQGAELEKFREGLKAAKNRDSFTELGYEAELRYYQEILQNGGRIGDAQNTMRLKFPDVRFGH